MHATLHKAQKQGKIYKIKYKEKQGLTQERDSFGKRHQEAFKGKCPMS